MMSTDIGPYADWDRPLDGQQVYFIVEYYPDAKKATAELRAVIEDTDEMVTPGRPKKGIVDICTRSCEEVCDDETHRQPMAVWIYTPKPKKVRPVGLPRQVLRCSACRLLCLASGRGKAYVHGAWNGFKVDQCPGSKKPCLDPKTTKRNHLEAVK